MLKEKKRRVSEISVNAVCRGSLGSKDIDLTRHVPFCCSIVYCMCFPESLRERVATGPTEISAE